MPSSTGIDNNLDQESVLLTCTSGLTRSVLNHIPLCHGPIGLNVVWGYEPE